MAERAAELDSTDFDVVFSAAHILRCVHVRDDAQLFATGGCEMQWFGVIGNEKLGQNPISIYNQAKGFLK